MCDLGVRVACWVGAGAWLDGPLQRGKGQEMVSCVLKLPLGRLLAAERLPCLGSMVPERNPHEQHLDKVQPSMLPTNPCMHSGVWGPECGGRIRHSAGLHARVWGHDGSPARPPCTRCLAHSLLHHPPTCAGNFWWASWLLWTRLAEPPSVQHPLKWVQAA